MIELIPAEFEPLDRRVAVISGDDQVERIYRGTRWAEGPVYFPAGRFLVWVADPVDGSRHDTYCLGESGVLLTLDPGNWVGTAG